MSRQPLRSASRALSKRSPTHQRNSIGSGMESVWNCVGLCCDNLCAREFICDGTCGVGYAQKNVRIDFRLPFSDIVGHTQMSSAPCLVLMLTRIVDCAQAWYIYTIYIASNVEACLYFRLRMPRRSRMMLRFFWARSVRSICSAGWSNILSLLWACSSVPAAHLGFTMFLACASVWRS